MPRRASVVAAVFVANARILVVFACSWREGMHLPSSVLAYPPQERAPFFAMIAATCRWQTRPGQRIQRRLHFRHRWRRAVIAEVDDVRRPVALGLPARRIAVDLDGRALEGGGDMGQAGIDADRQRRALRQRHRFHHRQLRQHARIRHLRRQLLRCLPFGFAAPRQQHRHAARGQQLRDRQFAAGHFLAARAVPWKNTAYGCAGNQAGACACRRRRQAEIGRAIGCIAERRGGHQAAALHRVGARADRHAVRMEDARQRLRSPSLRCHSPGRPCARPAPAAPGP